MNKGPTRSLLFVKTPTELVSPLVSPTVRFSFEDFEWKPQKSSLKKPTLQALSTPSKRKRVRFNNVASQMFYPVSHFYPDGYLVSPDNKITRRGLFLVLAISLSCVASGFMAYSAGLVLLAGILWALSFLLSLAVSAVIFQDLYIKHRGVIEIRRQKLGP